MCKPLGLDNFPGKDQTDYVEEFIHICHNATCDDLALMDGFRSELDDGIRFVMSKGNTCWTLEECINFTLWVDGSSFFMGEAEEDTISVVQPHLAPVTCHPCRVQERI
ncbi:hypothetical protein DPX16_17353 [Anabarilius grahami]|uniref:Uncharacterized protein n=1 Tax=Anabarilius grahami TaxID=495550 RepID=A0A3N0Y0F8_ANAGA|nr:hypothetical protein DPX16_17353 [Anabarilius grahami]